MRTLLLAFACLLGLGMAARAGEITYVGGDGSSEEKAIVMKGALDDTTATAAEYAYLRKHYPGYKFIRQSLLSGDKKVYDQLDFADADGHKHSIFFDITATFGKF